MENHHTATKISERFVFQQSFRRQRGAWRRNMLMGRAQGNKRAESHDSGTAPGGHGDRRRTSCLLTQPHHGPEGARGAVVSERSCPGELKRGAFVSEACQPQKNTPLPQTLNKRPPLKKKNQTKKQSLAFQGQAVTPRRRTELIALCCQALVPSQDREP